MKIKDNIKVVKSQNNYNFSQHWENTIQRDSPLFDIIKEYPNEQDRDVVYLSALTMLSSIMPNYFGWWNGVEYSPHLYAFFFGKTTTSKSKATVLQGVLSDIDDNLRSASLQVREGYSLLSEDEKAKTPKPPLQKLEFSADLTSASLFKDLEQNEADGGIIVTSEASHLGVSMGGEHGRKISAYLRSCFSHEVVSKSLATDDYSIKIKKPRLALLLAGTHKQLIGLVGGDNSENGLIGRFFFRQTFRSTENKKFRADTNVGGQYLKKLKGYTNQIYLDFKNSEGIHFDFTGDNLELYRCFCEDRMLELGKLNEDYEGIMMRLAIVGYRFLMILTAIRYREDIKNSSVLTCHGDDLAHVIAILNNLIIHTLSVQEQVCSRVEVFKATKLTILNGLPPEFTYTNFTTFAVSKGVNLRTSRRWLEDLLTKKVIKRLEDERGYIKVSKPHLKFK